ncbi:hypothetical protein DPPLL_13720 [Desulfofustis limnaeus]|uniref:Thioesterase domain-containing protein n=2 Tax=Desulfofustis limnaeus TaxID=2740163 RepID=A0ABN6M278_9BACT|nr:hypothetical protein DPPLL_13720 [Desulfofustis limnaeus]
MGWTSYVFSQKMAVTSDLNFKFLQPVYIGENKIKITCRVSSEEGPKINMQATLSDSEGAVCTTGKGTFHILPPEKYKKLICGNNTNKAQQKNLGDRE